MSKGFLFFATGKQYVLQACLAAMSLKVTRNNWPISIVTNDKIPDIYFSLFDSIIPIPWYDYDNTQYQTLNRWKVYHASPYDNTIVLDTDTIVLENLNDWWKFFENYDIYYLNKVYTYRQTLVDDNYYRKAFKANILPNLYNGLHYFNKSQKSKEFFSWLEIISKNWELFYGNFCKEYYPKFPSMDITVAIASKILNNDQYITNSKINFLHFVHMKPKIQNWVLEYDSWQDKVGVYLTKDLQLIIGNYLQKGVFHYTENSFVTEYILNEYESYLKL